MGTLGSCMLENGVHMLPLQKLKMINVFSLLPFAWKNNVQVKILHTCIFTKIENVLGKYSLVLLEISSCDLKSICGQPVTIFMNRICMNHWVS